jgi:hypothetical protein
MSVLSNLISKFSAIPIKIKVNFLEVESVIVITRGKGGQKGFG